MVSLMFGCLLHFASLIVPVGYGEAVLIKGTYKGQYYFYATRYDYCMQLRHQRSAVSAQPLVLLSYLVRWCSATATRAPLAPLPLTLRHVCRCLTGYVGCVIGSVCTGAVASPAVKHGGHRLATK